MRPVITALIGCMIAGSALAEEPAGCDQFKWPLDKERAMLTSANAVTVASGMSVALPLPVALSVNLVPFADAKLPVAPERAPRAPDMFAGFISVPALTQGGSYKITLSADAWIDVVQAGHLLKSGPHSGATGCQGMRKSVKFDLAAEPFVVQLSNVKASTIGIAITAD
jgi:hypothetical protein